MVAESDRPVDPEMLHESRYFFGGQLVVECRRLEENGERHVARYNNKVGLLCLNHRGDCVYRLRVLLEREPAAAEMYVAQLHDLEIAVGRERPVAVLFALPFSAQSTSAAWGGGPRATFYEGAGFGPLIHRLTSRCRWEG